jgi:hypothetical protein
MASGGWCCERQSTRPTGGMPESLSAYAQIGPIRGSLGKYLEPAAHDSIYRERMPVLLSKESDFENRRSGTAAVAFALAPR